MAPSQVMGGAAAWAAPLFSQLKAAAPEVGKLTHKLPPMPCVLWLPDFGAYVRSVNVLTHSFHTSPTAEQALCMGEELAMGVGRDLAVSVGLRVELRPHYPARSASAAASQGATT